MRCAVLACLAALTFSAGVYADTPKPQVVGQQMCQGRAGVTGEALITFNIAVDGTIKDIQVATYKGDPHVGQYTIDCARDWRYEPVVVDGKPVEFPWKARVRWYSYPSWLMATEPRGACGGVDPPPSTEANETNAETGTTLAFRIGVDGNLKDVFVARSSGSAAFDAMALRCAATWTYRPIPGSTPGEVPWTATLRWVRTAAAFVPYESEHLNPRITCDDSLYPPDALKSHTEGIAVLGYTIGAYGVVKDTRMVKSSGSAALDGVALACAKTWQYTERKFQDPAFSEPWGAQVFFRNGHILVLQMQNPA